MIEFQQVTKKYGRGYALNNVSFQLDKGKIYGLIGPNGSGKSTTLKMIAGLVHPSSGQVLVDGIPSSRRVADRVAYLTELDMFYPSFTVKDTIQFAATQFSDFQMDKADELLIFMKLDPDKKVKQLSKGNRGRLKLVVVLARNTPILLLDEPFSGLDPMVRDSIVKGLLSYIDFDNQTVIITTHEILEVESILDEVIGIKDGNIIARHHVEELREREGLSVLDWMKKNL
ncbi:ABC transporter ATP-binding protein [Bacillus sp. 03113]|uniref:ABC transporter ATP-binding protein n=1 Tax=Bacillus sp. 03113 TaxID=2578211 RepID=UPI001141FC0C|nr:ABC transporter ATP-binding protein [Bacillus sp. 03113]